MKKVLLIINCLIILFVVFIAYELLRTNPDNIVPTVKDEPITRNFDLSAFLKNNNDVENTFPYQKFAISEDYLSYKFLKEDINKINLITKDHSKTETIIYAALTDSLLKNKPSIYVSNIDTLISTFQWADKFRVYAHADSINYSLYLAINEFWMSRITEKLANLSKEKSSIINNFKFKYLLTRCNEVKYNPAIKNGSITKFVQNLLKGNWAHLFHATWDQASKLQLFLLFTFGIITLFSYTLLFKSIYTLLKK